MVTSSPRGKNSPPLIKVARSTGGVAVHGSKVKAVMAAAEQSGLLAEKRGRIGGRVSETLVQRAKEKTGITSDTELIEFALANLAVEDRFAEAFKSVRGTVDPGIEIGF